MMLLNSTPKNVVYADILRFLSQSGECF